MNATLNPVIRDGWSCTACRNPLFARVLRCLVLFLLTAATGHAQTFRVVVLGSSTAVGVGAIPLDSSWVNKYKRYLQVTRPPSEVINLAADGYTIFNVMPTDYTPPSPWDSAKFYPVASRNITYALSLNPSMIIVNLPSNDCNLHVPVALQVANYDQLVQLADENCVPIWITSTQPRTATDRLGRDLLKEMRDTILARYAPHAIDFWTGLARDDGSTIPDYDYDGSHLNTAGHSFLFRRVRGATTVPATVDGQVVEVRNDGAVYSVKVQLKVDAAAGLGGATLSFLFNESNLSFPASPTAGLDYTFHAFSDGSYAEPTVARPEPNRVTANIQFMGGTPTNVNTTFTDVVTINFTTLVPEGSSNLNWATTQFLADDQLTSWTNGTFTGINSAPLPIQLASFVAGIARESGNVLLHWSTAGEIANYGFYVQRSKDEPNNYQTLENSFVPGHGTTVEPHLYSFTDAGPKAGVWYYRLEQVDLDGSLHHSHGIRMDRLTDVGSKPLPTVFALDQNFPNPFNPTTVIRYHLPASGQAGLPAQRGVEGPAASEVKLVVYDLLCREVAVLVNERQTPGSYTVQFNAAGLASGVYLYRLIAGDLGQTRKLIVLR